MAPNRITRGPTMRRALLVLALAALAVGALASCGGGGSASNSAPTDKEADAAVLNEILTRQIAVVGAYRQILPSLQGGILGLAQVFSGQEQEHVDATLKALRGLGKAEAEPDSEEIEVAGPKTPAEYLELLYTMESATINAELAAVAKLTGSGGRTLMASTLANQAQHLVLLRRALGAAPAETVPFPFETGETPAP